MVHLVLFDDPQIRENLLPFTFTRPVAGIRVGIRTIAEKWSAWLGASASHVTQPYLQPLFPVVQQLPALFVNGGVCPSDTLIRAMLGLRKGESLWQKGTCLGFRTNRWPEGEILGFADSLGRVNFDGEATIISQWWHIFKQNRKELILDFEQLTKGRTSAGVADKHTIVYNPERLFVEEGANIKAAIINAEEGPVYIGKKAVVQEGSLIRGALALCEGAHLNMGAKMRGDNTIGPYCKVGGEVSNSIFFGFSNKAHDGFLGNSVLGEWCNLGADTNTSNLKNNYSKVSVWSYAKGAYSDTGEQFCGLAMGDQSKCGINTMLNTGTVIGVGANVFGGGFPPKFIPSFAWGGAEGFDMTDFGKMMATTKIVMGRRNITCSPDMESMLHHIYRDAANEHHFLKKGE